MISCIAKCCQPKILLTYMTYNEYQQHDNFAHCIYKKLSGFSGPRFQCLQHYSPVLPQGTGIHTSSNS